MSGRMLTLIKMISITDFHEIKEFGIIERMLTLEEVNRRALI